jgi:branched-subunit amino acid ABC-type transport system permease component
MSVVNAIVQGILLGGLYALFACGLSLMFGVMRIINLAHGDIAVLGAFGVWVVTTQLGISPLVALLIALPVMLALGYGLQVTLLARSLKAGELTPLLTTFGLAIVIQNALLQIFSPDVRSLGAATGRLSIGSWRIADRLAVPYLGILVLVLAVAVLGGLQLMLARTRFGREMRATAQDPDTAGRPRSPSAPRRWPACSSASTRASPRRVGRRSSSSPSRRW